MSEELEERDVASVEIDETNAETETQAFDAAPTAETAETVEVDAPAVSEEISAEAESEPETDETVIEAEATEVREEPDAARVETFTENLRITVAITDAAGKPLKAQSDENGEVYVVSAHGTKLIKSEEETQKAKKNKRARSALGLLCFFSIMFIAIAILLDVIFKNALPDLEYVGTIFSSFAQAVAYLFLAINGFRWIQEPGRKLGWKIAYWIGVVLVFVTLIVGTTLAFTHLIPSK